MLLPSGRKKTVDAHACFFVCQKAVVIVCVCNDWPGLFYMQDCMYSIILNAV